MTRIEEILLNNMTTRRWIWASIYLIVIGAGSTYIGYLHGRNTMERDITTAIHQKLASIREQHILERTELAKREVEKLSGRRIK